MEEENKVLNVLKNKYFWIILCLVIPMVFAWNIRTFNQDLPITDDWAKQSVDNYVRNQILNNVNSQYPNLPDDKKSEIVNQEFSDYYSNNKQDYDSLVMSQSKYFKDSFKYANANGKADTYPYMPDIDPYHFLRYARNIEEKGTVADSVNNGVMWDDYMNAPIGTSISIDIHPYVLFGIYKVMHFFDNNITLMQSSNYFPAIIILLSIIPAFFLARRIGGNVAGFFAGMFIAVMMSVFSRTMWGHADTDAYNIFFPLMMAWLFYEIFEAKNYWKQMTITLLLSMTLAIYSIAWNGWWYMFDFILAILFTYFLYLLWKNKFNILNKNISIITSVSSVLVMGTYLFSVAFNSTNFWYFIKGPFQFLSIKNAGTIDLWPNVLTTVAEMNNANYSQIIAQLGGSIFLIITILGFIWIGFKKDDDGNLDFKHSLLLILWFVSTIFASLKGVRFIVLIAPAMAIGFGSFIGLATKYLKDKSHKIHMPEWITVVLAIMVFSLLFITPIKSAYSTAKQDVPIMNDAWYDSLTKIKDNSNQTAIINSWWDFGHHFKYVANRSVTFDGASQVGPQAHWIGKVLLTDDEKEAIGILRMLDCGANEGFYNLNSHINYTPKSVEILYSIVRENETKAKEILYENGLGEYSTDILNYTHCHPPEDYIIVSQDMVGKSGVWSHFGGWDFHKADLWINLKSLYKEKALQKIMDDKYGYGWSLEEANMYWSEMMALPDEDAANSWISPWPSYGQEFSCNSNNETKICGGIIINSSGVELSTAQGFIMPMKYSNVVNGSFVVKDFNSTNKLAVSDFGDGAIISDYRLAGSMFDRLFFFDGVGLEHFEKFSDVTDITGSRIIVYKINWGEFS